MSARAEDTKVRIGLHWNDPETYLGPLNELIDAEEALYRDQPDLPTVDLRPLKDRVGAAEADVDDLFSDVYSIESAEKICTALFAAITQAKAAAGRFNGGDE